MADKNQQGMSEQEIEEQQAADLPDREAMTTLTVPTLLDLDANLDLNLDLAAPVNAGVAANANAGVPLDASVGANVLSSNSAAISTSVQNAPISQTLDGTAIANADQTSSIDQAGK